MAFDLIDKEYDEVVALLKELGVEDTTLVCSYELLGLRAIAKYKKDYATADKIKELLIKFGYKIEDLKNGTSRIIKDHRAFQNFLHTIYVKAKCEGREEATREHKYKPYTKVILATYMCRYCGRIINYPMVNQQCPRCDEFNSFVKLVPENRKEDIK